MRVSVLVVRKGAFEDLVYLMIKSHNGTPKVLPAIHSTRVEFARSIVKENKLSCLPRKEFDEMSLLFFYYGRPAYCWDGKTAEFIRYPVVFVFSEVESIFAIYPFDTGACCLGRYKKVKIDRDSMDDFRLSNKISDLPGFVSDWWGTNKRYYHSQPLPRKYIRVKNERWKRYADLIYKLWDKNGFSVDGLDRRCHTLEIISNIDAVLDDKLLRVIAPHEFWKESKEFEDIENRWKDRIIGYSPSKIATSGKSAFECINEILESYLSEQKAFG